MLCTLRRASDVDWEKIALEVCHSLYQTFLLLTLSMFKFQVGTKRSPLDCQTQWFNSQSPLILKTPIEQAELSRLLQIAHTHGYRDWDAITQELNVCLLYFVGMWNVEKY